MKVHNELASQALTKMKSLEQSELQAKAMGG